MLSHAILLRMFSDNVFLTPKLTICSSHVHVVMFYATHVLRRSPKSISLYTTVIRIKLRSSVLYNVMLRFRVKDKMFNKRLLHYIVFIICDKQLPFYFPLKCVIIYSKNSTHVRI